jgi:hypothetical protein
VSGGKWSAVNTPVSADAKEYRKKATPSVMGPLIFMPIVNHLFIDPLATDHRLLTAGR